MSERTTVTFSGTDSGYNSSVSRFTIEVKDVGEAPDVYIRCEQEGKPTAQMRIGRRNARSLAHHLLFLLGNESKGGANA